MKSQVRSIRERLAHVKFEVSKQEIKIIDLEDSIEEKRKQNDRIVEAQQTLSPDNQFYLEDMIIQLSIERLILSKLEHHIRFLMEDLERNK